MNSEYVLHGSLGSYHCSLHPCIHHPPLPGAFFRGSLGMAVLFSDEQTLRQWSHRLQEVICPASRPRNSSGQRATPLSALRALHGRMKTPPV